MWPDMGRCREIHTGGMELELRRGHPRRVRLGEIWGDTGRYREIYGGTPAAYGSGEKPASTTRPATTLAPSGSTSAYLGTSHGASSPQLAAEASRGSWSQRVPTRVVRSTPRRASSKA